MGDDLEGGDSFFKKPVRRIRLEDEGYPPSAQRQRRSPAPSDAELEQIIHDMLNTIRITTIPTCGQM